MLKSSHDKKIGLKPPFMIYAAGNLFLKLKFIIKYGLEIENSEIRHHKGPAIVLAVHTSGQDHILSGLALWRQRPVFVTGEHFNTQKKTRNLLKLMKTVSKKMFCPDLGAVIGIMKAIKAGNTVVLFPEGRLTWHGRSMQVTDGTAELVKKLGVDVFVLCARGAGKSFPKWATYERRGKIKIEVNKLFGASELEALSVENIDEKIRAAIKHNEDHEFSGVRYKTKDTSAGLEKLLWVCPECRKTHTLRCENGHITCTECGLDAILDEYGYIAGTGSKYGINTVGEWYDFCSSTLDISKELFYECNVGTTDSEGYMVRNCGVATVTVSAEKITFKGTVNAEPLEFELNVDAVKSFPLTPGDHVDIYYKSRLYLLSPKENPNRAVIMAEYLDRVAAEKGL